MACEVIVDNISREDWERYAGNFADYSIYQTWAYQQVRAEMDGQEVNRVVVKDENGHVATMCQIRIKHFKPLGLRIGYVQWGPLFRAMDGTLKCSVEALRALREAYVGTKVNVLRVLPNAEANQTGREFAAILESVGFEYVSSVKPHLTMMVPVDDSEEQMRRRLHRSWRRGLIKAERNGIEIKESADSKYFEILEKMYVQIKKRKRFKGLNPQEFVRTQRMLSPEEKMNVITAYWDGEPIASHASSHLGDTAVGTLAACSEKGLECSASYLVWWRTFLAAKRAGMKSYDLGGIDPDNTPTVYQFKSRMGGKEQFHIGAFEACDNWAIRTIWRMSERNYNLIRK
ncbi:peptidoglycan bridge formation glycyltransferase FemA/FemB family protein [bacterium]|nr:peptidoglycan bridge formation glycyltransferase FemA/FemB family protein [bacterium]